jgi:hypothetical protein
MDVAERIKLFDKKYDDIDIPYDEYMNVFKQEFPDLYYIKLNRVITIGQMLKYVTEGKYKGAIKTFYSKRVFAFEYEQDKTFFLLKYGQ